MTEYDANGSVRTSRIGHVLHIEIDRHKKRNAFTPQMIVALCQAYDELEADPEAWCGLVTAVGEHFSAGLDLAAMAPVFAEGNDLIPVTSVNPWSTTGKRRTKPVVVACQGTCITATIELILAADVAVAAEDASFAQLEVSRGIVAFGGATFRFEQRCGRGNAMRWVLTGDTFDAAEALRIGLVQQVVPVGQQFDAALEVATRIAAQAPLAVQASLENGWLAKEKGEQAAIDALLPKLRQLLASEDAAEGMASFMERRTADYKGR